MNNKSKTVLKNAAIMMAARLEADRRDQQQFTTPSPSVSRDYGTEYEDECQQIARQIRRKMAVTVGEIVAWCVLGGVIFVSFSKFLAWVAVQ